ncbi:hypothetical protein [Pseudomarimonas salicorniae]|uniref:Uncharacterized protein n=1 Tax=Pseudomarimonas salicorniae TaxID=2933270 RepID=A0ABT0GKJ9_9GAMM|nr:hypothetical protein [Lysobacter sp. CAU 1642]MCK7594902.1 hypothetical protein [Lysobacter sp. CAU 1642]
MISYRVIPSAHRFAVFREGVHKGVHDLEARAIQAAKFMAAVEASRFGEHTEVLLHLPGRVDLLGSFSPGEALRPPLPALQVGDELVALR